MELKKYCWEESYIARLKRAIELVLLVGYIWLLLDVDGGWKRMRIIVV